MIKVSVIIPVYNVEAFLPDCLDSVLSQTLKEIEVICIDDASPDDCGRILDDYAAKDNRMKVFHLDQNHRQGYGRNLGLKNAAGEYVYFLDSDDMIVPEAMEELYEIAKKDNLDAIFFDTQTIFKKFLRSVNRVKPDGMRPSNISNTSLSFFGNDQINKTGTMSLGQHGRVRIFE